MSEVELLNCWYKGGERGGGGHIKSYIESTLGYTTDMAREGVAYFQTVQETCKVEGFAQWSSQQQLQEGALQIFFIQI